MVDENYKWGAVCLVSESCQMMKACNKRNLALGYF